MATNSKEIISYLEKNHPQDDVEIKNCSEENFGFSKKVLNQYIIGVTPGDKFSPGIGHYENYMKKNLTEISRDVQCLAWPFDGYEMNEMKMALDDLSNRFNVTMDIENMIKSLKVPRDESGKYYIVVTVVKYAIAYVE